jgi:hypothetical protein
MAWGEKLTQKRMAPTAIAASASTIQQGEGAIKLVLTLSAQLSKDCGRPGHVTIFPGDGAQAGQLKLQFHAAGEFRIYYSKAGGGGRVTMPLPAGVPDQLLFASTRCQIVSHSKTEVVIALPLKEWKAEAGK